MGELKDDEKGESEALHHFLLFINNFHLRVLKEIKEIQKTDMLQNQIAIMVERDKVFGMIENISISTYTIISFFISFLVFYYVIHSFLPTLLLSILISILTFLYFRKRGILLEQSSKK